MVGPFENLPKLPQLSKILREAKQVRQVVEDARNLIKTGREEISSIASAFRVEGRLLPESEPESESQHEVGDEIKGGTAGKVCSDEHISQASSDLKEALRMARSRGIKDREVRDRLQGAREELNSMERRDMVAEKILQYPPEQQVIARWLLPRSAAIRHTINELLMRGKEIDDLEKLSAYASLTARELTDRIDALPKEQKASDECLEVKQLGTFLEEQHIKRGEVRVEDAQDFLKGKGVLK